MEEVVFRAWVARERSMCQEDVCGRLISSFRRQRLVCHTH